MKNKFLQYLFLSCSLMVLFSACRKDPNFNGNETLEAGKTFVWFTSPTGDAQENDVHFLPFTDIKQVNMFTIRRDAANTADLQKAITITTKTISVDTYNAKFGTDYAALPATLATPVADEAITTSSAGITFKFAAGVFAKPYLINVDGSKFDQSKKYALILEITSFGGFSAKHDKDGVALDTIVCTLGVKNIYDGDYTSEGSISFPDPTSNRTFTGLDKTLTTINATTNIVDVADLGGAGYFMYLKVNADNTVTVTPATISANQTIQNNGDCTYDPDTKKYTLNYKYIGGTGDRVIHEELTHK